MTLHFMLAAEPPLTRGTQRRCGPDAAQFNSKLVTTNLEFHTIFAFDPLITPVCIDCDRTRVLVIVDKRDVARLIYIQRWADTAAT